MFGDGGGRGEQKTSISFHSIENWAFHKIICVKSMLGWSYKCISPWFALSEQYTTKKWDLFTLGVGKKRNQLHYAKAINYVVELNEWH